ncbi:MAG: DNA polymerase III subunit gamma/tau [Malacoplasma sp.]
MEHFVFYRKYRPKSFKEVQGQEFIIKTLQNSIINDNLSHTYIFSGPRGTGKTSIAKIFSKALNCLSSKNGDCCNECKNCILIDKNEEVDIIEIDAASNNGVGEIRNIIDNIFYLPMVLKNKVYIIDEAHMLTSFAWNAFLKTLEDTPKNLIFIFATTEQHKIPATIISRCQRYNFAKISISNLVNYINSICGLERIIIDEESVKKIAYLSDGSLRDALSILDQLSTFTSKNIKINDVNKVFGLIDISSKIELIQNIVLLNIDKIIKTIEHFDESGIDLYQLCIEIVEILLDKIIYEKTKNYKLLKVIQTAHINFIEVQPKILFQFISIWEEAMMQIKNHSNAKFFFELACLNSSRLFSFDENKTNANSSFNPIKIPVKISENKIDEISNLKNLNTKQDNIPNNKNIFEKEEISDIGKKNMKKIELKNILKSSNVNPVDIAKPELQKDVMINETPKELNSNSLTKEDITNIVKNSIKIKNVDLLSIEPSNLKDMSEQKFNNIKNYDSKPNEILDNINNVNDNSVKNKTINIDNKINNNETIVNLEKQEELVVNNKVEEKQEELVTNNKVEQTTDSPNKKNKNSIDMIEEDTLFSVSDDNVNNPAQIVVKPKVIIESTDSHNPSDSDGKDYSTIFNQIAFNKNDVEKERLNKILMSIKDNVPICPEEGYFVDSLKIIIASQNGFVVLFDDDISAKNLNFESSEPKFINYVKSKFGRVFKVLAVNKNMVINYTQIYKENVAKKNRLSDVNIDSLFELPEIKEVLNKDIAIELLGNLIKED